MKQVLTHYHRAFQPGEGESSRRVRSAREFASILNRERDRTDRTGQEFSLVVFETGDGSRRSASVRNFVAILAQRIRPTDDIGWLEDGRMAAALPHTLPDGAWKFVENFRRALGESALALGCTVYVYPSQWITRVDRTTPSPRDTGPPPEPKVEDPACSRSIEELDSNFLHPLPAWKRAILRPESSSSSR